MLYTGCLKTNATFSCWSNYQLPENCSFNMTIGPIIGMCFYHGCVIEDLGQMGQKSIFLLIVPKKTLFYEEPW